MKRLILPIAACLTALFACTPQQNDTGMVTSPLLLDAQKVARAKHVVIAVPGALASVDVFDPIDEWASDDVAIIYYRLPGLDGLSLEEPLNIDTAAARIADYANQLHGKSFYLVGFSTGSAVLLESAKKITSGPVKHAGISTALPFPQPLFAGLRGFRDNISAAWRAGSLDSTDRWYEYYRTLLFGRGVNDDPEKSARADAILSERKSGIVVPTFAMSRAHSADLTTWSLTDIDQLSQVEVRLFHGADDPAFPSDHVVRFAARLPNGAATIYPDNGHLLLVTQPGLFDDIRRYFAF